MNDERTRVVVKRKGGTLGKIIALLIGFILGVGSIIGGVAGLGFYLTKKPVQYIEGKVNGLLNQNLNFSEYLTDEYYQGTVLNLFGGVQEAVREISAGNGSFATLAKISPAVEDSLGKIAETLCRYGSRLPEDTIRGDLLNTPFSDFGTYLGGTLVDSIEIGPMLVGTQSFSVETLIGDEIMMTLLYGVEDEDYKIVTNGGAKEIVPVEGGKAFLSVGDLRTDGVTDSFARVPIDALFAVKEEDGIMCALAYGSSSRYRFTDATDADGNPTRKAEMNPLVYTRNAEDKFFLDGEELACTATPAEGKTGEYLLTFSDESQQYVKKIDGSDPERYEAFTSSEMTKQVRYAKRTFNDLLNDSENILNGIEVASVANIDANSGSLLRAFAYGVEGEDYDIVGSGENKQIVMRDGKKPKTIGELKNLDSAVLDMPIDALLEIDPDDGMLRSIAYGNSSRYTIETAGGVKTVRMNQVEYAYSAEKWYDIDGKELNAVRTSTEQENVYTLTITDAEGNVAQAIVKEDGGKYYEYSAVTCAENEKVLYKKRTVRELQDAPSDLIESIPLSELLGVSPLNPDDDKIMIALAYGNRGQHYHVADGEIVWHTDGSGKPYAPRTIGSLMKGNDTFKDLYVCDILDVNLSSHPVLIALAYGEKGKDYKIESGTILPISFPRTLRDIHNNSEEIINSVTVESALSVTATSEKTVRAIAYGRQGVHYEIVDGEVTMLHAYYAFEQKSGDTQKEFYDKNGNKAGTYQPDGLGYILTRGDGTQEYVQQGVNGNWYVYATDKTTPVLFNKNTLGDLSQNGSALIKNLTLEDVIGDLSGNFFLKHLSDVTIDELPAKMEDLTIAEVFKDDVYVDPNAADPQLKGTWKYLLTDSKDPSDPAYTAPEAYKLTQFSALVSNMSANMQKATLNDLYADDIISLTDPNLLNTDLYTISYSGYTITKTPTYEKLGDLTITEVIDYLNDLLAVISALP